MSNRVSLCIIAKNEGENIKRCLASVVGFVNEIIVVDTGSIDNTPEVAESFGASVYKLPWNDNFSDARNFSLEKATGDWVLFMDADEELAAGSGERLLRLVAEDKVEGYFTKIINYIGDVGWIEACPDLVFRLFRNRPNYRFRGAIHEQIADVILEQNNQASYRIGEGVIILHYGYLERQISDKDKKNRNMRLLEKELEQRPNDQILLYHYGVELYRAERFGEAAEILVKVAENINPATIYFPKLIRYIVMSYKSANQPERSLQAALLGLKFFPDYADLYYYAGLIHLEAKNFSKAEEMFSKAVSMPEQAPQYASFSGVRGFRSLYHLGQIAEEFLNYEQALSCYLKSLQQNSQFLHPLERIIYILNPRENPEDTKESLEKILDFSELQAVIYLGDIFFKQRAYKLALEFIELALTRGSHTDGLLFRKGYCLIQQRRHLEALRLLTVFKPDNELYAQAKFNELLCYWVQGKKKKVRTIVQELRALDPVEDTDTILSLILNTLDRRKTVRKIELGSDAVLLLLDIIMRLIDLGESGLINNLLSRVADKSLENHSWDIIKLYYELGHKAAAAELLEEYLAREKSNGEAHYVLAEILRETGDYPRAERHYRLAAEVDPHKPKYYIGRADLYKDWQERAKEQHSEDGSHE